MSDDLKEAILLLMALGNECRYHEEKPKHKTNPKVKAMLFRFMDKHGMSDHAAAVKILEGFELQE